MLGGILNRLTGGARRGRPAGPGGPTVRGRPPTHGGATGTTGANRDVERGAKTLLRGLLRRR